MNEQACSHDWVSFPAARREMNPLAGTCSKCGALMVRSREDGEEVVRRAVEEAKQRKGGLVISPLEAKVLRGLGYIEGVDFVESVK